MQKQTKQPNTKEHEQIQQARNFFSGVAIKKRRRLYLRSPSHPMGHCASAHCVNEGCR